MQIDRSTLVTVVAVTVFAILLASIFSTVLAQKQIVLHVMKITSTTTPLTSLNTNNITLGNPQFNYTENTKTTSIKPVIVNGTRGIEVIFTGHGVLNGINITDNGNAVLTNGTNGTIFTKGDGKLVSNNGAGTLAFAFQGTGHYGSDGKLRDIGNIFQVSAGNQPIPFKATGNIAFLDNTVAIYKDEIGKGGNAITKFWFWK